MLLAFQHLSTESPPEGFGQHFVEVVNKVQYLFAQVFLGIETASTDDATHQNAKPNLHLIQPRRVFRCVYEADGMTNIRQELFPARYRLQHPVFSLLTQGVRCDPAQQCHQQHQPFRQMDVQLVRYNDPTGFRICCYGLFDVLDKILFVRVACTVGDTIFPVTT